MEVEDSFYLPFVGISKLVSYGHEGHRVSLDINC